MFAYEITASAIALIRRRMMNFMRGRSAARRAPPRSGRSGRPVGERRRYRTRERFGDAGDRLQLVDARAAHRRRGAEALDERLFARGPDAGEAIERGRHLALAADPAVIGDGEAVG